MYERIEEGSLEIGDPAYAINLLAQVHGEDPRRAVREFVENSKDAGASKVTVIIERYTKEPYISVRDNGEGITIERLHCLPKEIANSIKRRERLQTAGIHGIGLLSFMTIASRLMIITRPKGFPETQCLEIGKDLRYRLWPSDQPRMDEGTDVYVYGIDQKSRLLTIERIAEYLAREFETDLREGRVRIELIEGRKLVPVRPEAAMVGYQLIERVISTSFGDIKVDIRYGAKGLIRIYRRGSLVCRDVAEIPEVEAPVWKSGSIGGVIQCDFLSLTTDKRGLVRDGTFASFMTVLRSLGAELEEEVKRIEELRQERDIRRITRYLSERFDEVLSSLPQFDRVEAIFRSKPTDQSASKEGRPTLTGLVFGRRGVEKPKASTGKQPLRPGEGVRGRHGRGLVFDEEKFMEEPHVRSRFEPDFGTVVINIAHPDYVKVVEARDLARLTDYYYKNAAKEIVLYQFGEAEPQELLERLIDLQLCLERKPPAI